MKMRKLGITSLLLVTLCNCWWSFPVAESASGNQVLANGTIVFAPLPTNQEEFVPATYDAKGLDGYYAMSNGFTDVVRSGTLPYGERCEGEGGRCTVIRAVGLFRKRGCRLCRIPGATLKWLVSGSEQTCGFCCNRVWCGCVHSDAVIRCACVYTVG